MSKREKERERERKREKRTSREDNVYGKQVMQNVYMVAALQYQPSQRVFFIQNAS